MFLFNVQLSGDNEPTDQLDSLGLSIVQELGSTATTVSAAMKDPLVLSFIETGVMKANEDSVSRAAKVQVCVCVRERELILPMMTKFIS